jgi:hypothetical protein
MSVQAIPGADLKSIDEALAVFQADMPTLVKNRDGQAGNQKTKYADLEQANEVVLSRLNALGVIYVCTPTLLDDGKFVLAYELKHVPSDTAKVGRWPLKLSENPQHMGSATSYGRRYVLLAVTGVAAENEDDDGDAASGRQTAQRRQPQARTAPGGRTAQRAPRPARGAPPPLPGEDPDGPVGADQHGHMRALWRELGYDGDENRDQRLAITAKILGLPDLESSADLTRAQADTVIDALKERRRRVTSDADA